MAQGEGNGLDDGVPSAKKNRAWLVEQVDGMERSFKVSEEVVDVSFGEGLSCREKVAMDDSVLRSFLRDIEQEACYAKAIILRFHADIREQ